MATNGWRVRLFGPQNHFVLVPVLSVLAALAICFVAIWLTGRDPLSGYLKMFAGGLGSLRGLGDSSVKASVLALTGLSVAAAFSVGLFNIGAEGQLVVGAIAAAFVGQAIEPGSAWVHLPLCLLASALAGGLWGLVPAWLKVRRGVHEVISTIMLNWIAIHLVESWLVVGPLAARSTESHHSLPGTAQIAATAELPRFLGQRSDLGLGIVVAAAAAMGLYVLLQRTWRGFEMRAIGCSVEAARYAGIRVARRTYLAMALAGACAGLAGAVLILGVHRQYPSVFHAGYGFDGIAISLIGGNHPLGALIAAAFFGVIRAGGTHLQLLQIHRTFPELIQGLALLFVAGQMVTRHLLAKAAGSKALAPSLSQAEREKQRP
ncbi:MAG: ABC transporter permease [Deltaproteobacteria bacterium]|nr:ABC transporter permease [Deltaproteobacteria bacterium]